MVLLGTVAPGAAFARTLAPTTASSPPNAEAMADLYLNARARLSSVQRQAEDGDPEAQFLLGAAYYDRGFPGMSRDYGLAITWLERAAAQGNAEAMAALGLANQQGRALPRDPSAANAWYLKAIAKGDSRATFLHARLVSGDDASVDTDSLLALQDDEERTAAFRWFQAVANQGDPFAQAHLGLAYANGSGTQASVPMALIWFAKAAQQGHGPSAKRIDALLPQLQSRPLAASSVNLRRSDGSEAPIITTLERGTTIYPLNEPEDGWVVVYVPKGHLIGFISHALMSADAGQPHSFPPASQGSPWPIRPAHREGVNTCNTRCLNGDCYRTYSDGRQVHFQAKQVWNPMSNSFEWESGGC